MLDLASPTSERVLNSSETLLTARFMCRHSWRIQGSVGLGETFSGKSAGKLARRRCSMGGPVVGQGPCCARARARASSVRDKCEGLCHPRRDGQRSTMTLRFGIVGPDVDLGDQGCWLADGCWLVHASRCRCNLGLKRLLHSHYQVPAGSWVCDAELCGCWLPSLPTHSSPYAMTGLCLVLPCPDPTQKQAPTGRA